MGGLTVRESNEESVAGVARIGAALTVVAVMRPVALLWLAEAAMSHPRRSRSEHPVMKRRTFIARTGLATAAAGLGGGAWLYRSDIRQWLRPRLQLTPLEDLPGEDVDVCIIGSGPAGTTLGLDLAAAGVRTIILESGYHAAGRPGAERLNELERYVSAGSAEYPVLSTRARTVGGTSSMWTGRCSRLHPIDFERNAYTPSGAGWPIAYTDIEPYYARAETTLRVHGSPLSRYHAPRTGDLPYETPVETADLRELLSAVGVTLDDSPSSRGYYGSGPVRVARDMLPAFSEMDRAWVTSGATATRLVADADGTVREVEVRQLDGRARRLRPEITVLACGALESARLLLLSASDSFPAGLGNGGGHVGRWFTEHPNITFQAQLPTPKPSNRHELARSHYFYDEFKREGLGSVLLRFIWNPFNERPFRIGAAVEMAPRAENRVRLARDSRDAFGAPGVRLDIAFGERDRRTFGRIRELIVDLFGQLGATDVREEPLTWSHHHIGTCRMGADPMASVVDSDLRVHGCSNLYVLGSGAFVTGGAAHPTLLIVALAHRLSEHLVSRGRSGGPDRNPVARSYRPADARTT